VTGSDGAERLVTKRLAFFSPLRDPSLFDLIEFYRTDIEIFREMGLEVHCVTRLRDVIRTKPDIVFAWWWHRSFGVAMWARIRRIPIVVTGATDFRLPDLRWWARWARISLTALTSRLTSANLAISQFELQDLERVRAPRRRLAYLAVDTDFYAPTGKRSAHPTAAVVAQMNVGSMRRKGVLTAIEAVAILKAQGIDLELHLVGEETPDGRALLDDTIVRLGIADRVVRHGRLSRDEKKDILTFCTFYLQPSTYEGFGLALLEAMAAGAIPITSQAGSLPEVRGSAGSAIDQQNPADLAASLQAYLGMPRSELDLRSIASAGEATRLDRQTREALLQDLLHQTER